MSFNEAKCNKITVVDHGNELISIIKFRCDTDIRQSLGRFLEECVFPSFKSKEDLMFRIEYRNSNYKLVKIEILCYSGEDIMDVIVQSIVDYEDDYKRCRVYAVISIPLCMACYVEDYTQEKHTCA